MLALLGAPGSFYGIASLMLFVSFSSDDPPYGMNQPANRYLRRLNLTQRFMLGSLIILIAGMLSIGW